MSTITFKDHPNPSTLSPLKTKPSLLTAQARPHCHGLRSTETRQTPTKPEGSFIEKAADVIEIPAVARLPDALKDIDDARALRSHVRHHRGARLLHDQRRDNASVMHHRSPSARTTSDAGLTREKRPGESVVAPCQRQHKHARTRTREESRQTSRGSPSSVRSQLTRPESLDDFPIV